MVEYSKQAFMFYWMNIHHFCLSSDANMKWTFLSVYMHLLLFICLHFTCLHGFPIGT